MKNGQRDLTMALAPMVHPPGPGPVSVWRWGERSPLRVGRAGGVGGRAGALGRAVLLASGLVCAALLSSRAGADPGPAPPGAPDPGALARTRTLDINEYRVEGAELLSTLELERVLTRFLGPGRTLEAIEEARSALEKAYSDRGYQAVSVAIPPQTVRDGIVTLKVTEGRIERLRVHGAQHYLPSEIKREAPSLAEGRVPNFDDMVRDIVLLNQFPDRRVTPALRAGAIPGTVEVDLNVEDHLPLHGSLEVNNHNSPGTTATRVNGSIRYDNLWQLGHSLTLAFQIAPQRLNDGKVYSAAYLVRMADVPWLSFGFNGLIQDSNVSTLGGVAVTGKGQVYGARVNFTLPGGSTFFHSLSTGMDYKRFREGTSLGSDIENNPVKYWPATAQYNASWLGKSWQTLLTGAAVLNVRGLSSNPQRFDNKRDGSSGNFTYFRGSAEHTQGVPAGLQLYARGQGQYSASPLVGSEQFTVGGFDTVRGYQEAQAAGDYGFAGTLELRSPALLKSGGMDGRVLAFSDIGRALVKGSLPDQKSHFHLLSLGGGVRLKFLDHLSGSADLGLPLTSVGTTRAHHPRFSFRVMGEF